MSEIAQCFTNYEGSDTVKTIATKVKIGSDGILNLKIPTDIKEEVEVLIVLQPQALKPDESSKEKWPADFIEKTYGCLKEDPIFRHPQGEYPVREDLEVSSRYQCVHKVSQWPVGKYPRQNQISKPG